MPKASQSDQARYHPGYDPSTVNRSAGNCGCRGSEHWCAKHQADAARDAGRAAQEREAASRSK